MATDTSHYVNNVDPEEWPQQIVACATPGCVNEGIELQVPDIGQDVLCGGCGIHIIKRSNG